MVAVSEAPTGQTLVRKAPVKCVAPLRKGCGRNTVASFTGKGREGAAVCHFESPSRDAAGRQKKPGRCSGCHAYARVGMRGPRRRHGYASVAMAPEWSVS